MKNRSAAPHPRRVPPVDTRRLQEAESGSPILDCLLALIRGTAPPETPRASGGPIPFAPGSSGLDGPARSALRRWSAMLADDPRVRILIGGFTSQRSFTAEAMGLALSRVEAIRSHLRSLGIAPGRIDVAVCGTGWFVVERAHGATEEDPSGRCLLEIVDPRCAPWRN